MLFRYREMIYRPDFYNFDCTERYEWFPNGLFNYNVSGILKDLHLCKHELSDSTKDYSYAIFKASVDVEKAIEHNYGMGNLQEEHVEQADLSRPLLYAEVAPDCYNLIDGNHRLAKAYRKGAKVLPAYFLPADIAAHYLGSETEYSHYVEYWNKKIEDIKDIAHYQGSFAPVAAPIRERDLSASGIWSRMCACLNECRRVELYSKGQWFTLFRLNGKLFCGESELHTPSIRCAVPFGVTENSIAAMLPGFPGWMNFQSGNKELKEIRRQIRKKMQHADVLMACIRIFSEV